MDEKRIEELQKEFCFSIAHRRDEKGIIPHRNETKLKNQKLINEIKSAKWEIIAWIEDQEQRKKQEREEREKQEKIADLKKIQGLQKTGQIVYYFKNHSGEYSSEKYLGFGFHDEEYSKERNYREEYQKDMIWGNTATERHEVKHINYTDIQEKIREFGIGISDYYILISKNEYCRLLALEEQRKKNMKILQKEKKLKKAKKLEELKKKAKETGEVQWKQLCIIECQGGVEDCSFDSVSLAIYPDGTVKEVVSHCH